MYGAIPRPRSRDEDEEAFLLGGDRHKNVFSDRDAKTPIVYPRTVGAKAWSVILFVAVSLFLVVTQRGGSGIIGGGEQTTLSSSSSITIEATNEYGSTERDADDNMMYPFLVDAILFEPYKSHNLTVDTGDTGSAGQDMTYEIISRTDEGISYGSGTTAVDGDGVGTFTDVVVEMGGAMKGNITITLNGEVIFQKKLVLKRVKRKMMELTVADRDAFLDAFYTLWVVETVDGVELYGDKYKSMMFLNQIHVDAATYPGGCDMLHEKAGFITNHVYHEFYLAQSVNAVDPTVTVPYLDYGDLFASDEAQSHLFGEEGLRDGGAWTQLMSQDWFGEADPTTGEILNGRWKDFKASLVTTDFLERNGVNTSETFWTSDMWDTVYGDDVPKHFASPLGYQKFYWDTNYNDGKLRRYSGLGNMTTYNGTSQTGTAASFYGVTCEGFTSDMTTAFGDTFASLSQSFQGKSHAPAHFAIGNAGSVEAYANDAELKSRFNLTDNDLISIYWSQRHLFKVVYLIGMFASEGSTSTRFVTCSNIPFNDFNLDYDALNENDGAYVKEKAAAYGPNNIINCTFNADYFTDDTTGVVDYNAAIEQFFELTIDTGDTFSETTYLSMLSDWSEEDKKAFCDMIAERSVQTDGDLSTAAAPLDPFFWMLHGEVLRLVHRLMIQDLLSENSFINVDDCSGHNSASTAPWLKGFYFADADTVTTPVETYTLEELTDFINPLNEEFENKFDFVFAEAKYYWCPDFNDEITSYLETGTTSTKTAKTWVGASMDQGM